MYFESKGKPFCIFKLLFLKEKTLLLEGLKSLKLYTKQQLCLLPSIYHKVKISNLRNIFHFFFSFYQIEVFLSEYWIFFLHQKISFSLFAFYHNFRLHNAHQEALLYLTNSQHVWYRKTASEKIKAVASTKVREKNTLKHFVCFSDGIQMYYFLDRIIMFHFLRQWIYFLHKTKMHHILNLWVLDVLWEKLLFYAFI